MRSLNYNDIMTTSLRLPRNNAFDVIIYNFACVSTSHQRRPKRVLNMPRIAALAPTVTCFAYVQALDLRSRRCTAAVRCREKNAPGTRDVMITNNKSTLTPLMMRGPIYSLCASLTSIHGHRYITRACFVDSSTSKNC